MNGRYWTCTDCSSFHFFSRVDSEGPFSSVSRFSYPRRCSWLSRVCPVQTVGLQNLASQTLRSLYPSKWVNLWCLYLLFGTSLCSQLTRFIISLWQALRLERACPHFKLLFPELPPDSRPITQGYYFRWILGPGVWRLTKWDHPRNVIWGKPCPSSQYVTPSLLAQW